MELQLAWENEGRVVLTCAGQMGWDANDEIIKRVSMALADRNRPQVLLDLEAVEVITSAGLGSLLQIRKLVIERGGEMVLACPSPLLTQLFQTVGLDRHIPLADSLDDARTVLQERHCNTHEEAH